MTDPKKETFAVSIFDILENKPYVLTITAPSDVEPDHLVLLAVQQIFPDDDVTKQLMDAQPELFAGLIVLSIFQTDSRNLYDSPES